MFKNIIIQTLSQEIFVEVYKKKDNETLVRAVEEALLRNFTWKDLPFVTDDILSRDLEKQHFGVIGLRKILSYENDVCICEQVFEVNLVSRLIHFLKIE